MPKLKIISIEEELAIINLYCETNISIYTLCEKYGVGKIKIRDILLKHGIQLKKKGGQVVSGISSEIEKSKVILYEPKEGKKLIAICKKTGVVFDDANNISGCLTRYIIDTYGDVWVPTNTYQRKVYEKNNGKKWFEEYFDIFEVEIKLYVYLKKSKHNINII